MAGLVGVISNDRSRPVIKEELDGLVRAYSALRGDADPDVSSAGEWARIARVDGHVPGSRDEGPAGWMQSVGSVHADGDILSALPEQLDGQFAAIRYDAATDELSILTDPFGMQALYVCEHGDRTYVSTSSIALARHLPRPPDRLGQCVFLRAGYQIGPQTHWQGVERLDPATRMLFGPSGRRREVYWRPEVDPRVRRMGFRETVDHCVEVMLATLESRLGARQCLWADLTGGFDSRLVTVALRALGIPFRTVTTGEYEDSPDVAIARDVARVGGFPWQHDRPADEWVLDDRQARSALAWADGTLDVLQLGEVLSHKRRNAEVCAFSVTGGGGEHANAFPWLQEFLRAGRSREVNFENLLTMRYLHPVDLSVFREDPGPQVEEYFRARLAERVEPYAAELNTTKLDLIYAYKSTGHFGAYRSAIEAVMRQELPFYYRDIWQACFSARHRWRNAHRLQRAMIERLSPRVAAVRTTRGGPAARMRAGNAHEFMPYYTGLAQTAIRKLRRSDRKGEAEQERATARRRAAVRRLHADGVLDPGQMRSADLYDEAALDAFLRRAEGTAFSETTLLGRIVTVELLLRAIEPSA